MRRETFLRAIMVVLLCVNLAVPPGLMAQGAPGDAATQEKPAFRPEEIDQMVAPIALYPDALLAQVLTASTYPLEIVQAARFVQQNKELKGDKLMAAAKDKDWEPSVKAMLSFSEVLLMMNEQLEWTEKLGNAFLSQQKEVMASVQRLRQKAEASGNLKTTKEQKVVVEKETKVIVIESASPQVVYVPAYNPTVVYGVWAYPAYPPAPVYPPSYVAGTALLAFGVGVAVGASSSGYGAWGCGWGHNNNNIYVNNSTVNNFTKNNYTNAQKYQVNQNVKNQSWQHNPEHRKGAQYPNQGTAQKYGQQGSGAGARASTSDARGYGAGAGGAGGGRSQTSDLNRGAGAGGASAARPQTSDVGRGGGQESAFSGSGKGASERESSFRGQESRASSASQGGGASRGGSGGFSGGGSASQSSRGGGGGSSMSRGGGGGGGGRGGGGRR
jgi:hypothetical protein